MAGELILIVEDNEGNRKLVRDVLRFKGYQTIEVETGEESLRLARDSMSPGTSEAIHGRHEVLVCLGDESRCAEVSEDLAPLVRLETGPDRGLPARTRRDSGRGVVISEQYKTQ